MTPFPYAVDGKTDLHTALAMMREHGIRHLPITQDGQLAGVLSAREAETAQAMLGPDASEAAVPVWAVCTRTPYVVDLETTMDVVADEMANRQIGSALVVRNGKLAGIVTTIDVCRAYAQRLREDAGDTDDDVA